MIQEIEGIIISETNYGETSKILNVLTKDKGIVGMISKGCRSIKSSLRSSSAKLTYAKFNVYYKENKVSNIKEIDVINPFNNIKKDIIKTGYATFLLELVSQVYKHSNDLNVYNILISALIKINEDYDALILTNIVELKMLDFLGVMPNLEGCCLCGHKNVVTLSSDKGGYLCNDCVTDDPIISNKAIKLFRMYYYVDIDKISKLDVNNITVSEINHFLDLYYDRYTGLYLKSKKFLKDLTKLKK